ncbi:ABC transporter permease [Jannaschia donghaensis]|uniref:Daunorubicin resistance ABC transporter membrane protein n=1 Tax=Jannaschia donghaensis TaxID=420998 RepID=A0A0M6YHM4_9RHOB|nr:ABC transporter permease [Jannaschia donghaensis]CTQ49460.1 daunorubicin resistance ABC transporter membrane protein [Jannaschia donghaensis]
MTLAIVRMLALTLLRDRGALAMLLLLPPAIYVVFASIFATASGGEPHLHIGLAATAPVAPIEAALRAAPALTVTTHATEAALRIAIAEGGLDAGLLGRGALTRLDAAPLTILVDPAKPMAGAVLDGRTRAALAQAAPDILLERHAAGLEAIIGPLTDPQLARLDAARAALPRDKAGAPDLTVIETVGEAGAPDPAVIYYAGAIAFMFLLFSATQGANGLIDARESGILDRFAAGPGGIDVVVWGTALFLTAQGALQTAAVFAVAALVYDVPVMAHLPGWAVATALAAAAAAGFGLLCATACRTRAQAQAVSTFLVLLFSALGGSMVPRFLMPGWLRDIGAVAPNAWAVDLYQGLLARGLTLSELSAPVSALALLAVLGTGGAVLLSRRRMLL